MEVLILGAICLYSVSACLWVAWEGLMTSLLLYECNNYTLFMPCMEQYTTLCTGTLQGTACGTAQDNQRSQVDSPSSTPDVETQTSGMLLLLPHNLF